MARIKGKILRGDAGIWTFYIALIFISAVEVLSAMGKLIGQGSYWPLFIRHYAWLAVGFAACWIFHTIDYRKITRYLKLLLIVSIVLVILPYFVALINHQSISVARWIRIPMGLLTFQFQPSEITKYITIFYIACGMASNQDKIKSKEVFWSLMLPLLLVCGLIFISNFSTTILIFVTCFILMWLGRVNGKYLTLTAVVLVAGLALLLLIAYVNSDVAGFGRLGTVISRLSGRMDNDFTEINQINQALIAVSTGGLAGSGIGQSVQSRFLEEGHNDFIFSIILEEGGLWLGGFVILFYIVLIYRMFMVARRAQGYFGLFACLGFAIVMALQTLINMGVAVGLLPVTGQTLPFISYGGTSFLFASICLGIVLNISRTADTTEAISSREEKLQAAQQQMSEDSEKTNDEEQTMNADDSSEDEQ